MLGLLTVEAQLTSAGERKLAAGVSGLAVAAAVALLLCVTLLAADAARALRALTAARRPTAPPVPPRAGADDDTEEPSVTTPRAKGGS